jgi:transposase
MSEEKARRPLEWLEGRRLRAWALHEAGWTGKAIAEALGATEGAVSQWLKRAREGGPEALRRRSAPGAAPKLTGEQRARLPELLRPGAEAYGFLGEVWTTERVATVIQREWGVRYHPTHVGRLLRACGWSVQKPVRRASQRDEAAIQQWVQDEWPTIKKKPRKRSAPSSG